MKTELVEMTKDDEVIEVHPQMIERHKALGWKVVGEEPEVTTAEAPESEAGDSAKKKVRPRKRVGKKSAPVENESGEG